MNIQGNEQRQTCPVLSLWFRVYSLPLLLAEWTFCNWHNQMRENEFERINTTIFCFFFAMHAFFVWGSWLWINSCSVFTFIFVLFRPPAIISQMATEISIDVAHVKSLTHKSQHRYVTTQKIKVGTNLLLHFSTSTLEPLIYGKGLVISPHALLGMLLLILIYANISVNGFTIGWDKCLSHIQCQTVASTKNDWLPIGHLRTTLREPWKYWCIYYWPFD